MTVAGGASRTKVAVVGDTDRISAVDSAAAAQVSSANADQMAIAAEVNSVSAVNGIPGDVYAIAANFADKTKVSTAERSESAIFANQPIAAMVAVVDSALASTLPPLPDPPTGESLKIVGAEAILSVAIVGFDADEVIELDVTGTLEVAAAL